MKKILVLNDSKDIKRIYGSALDNDKYICVYCCKITISPVALLEKEKPDIVLTSLEWLPYQRLVIAEANRKSIPTLYVMDGILEWSYVWNNQSYVIPEGTMLQPLLSKHIAVIGKHPARILSAMGMKNKIHIVGLPRLDNFFRVRNIKKGQTPQILVCCANTPYHNKEQEIMVKRALKDLKNELDCYENYINVIWRIGEELSTYIDVENSNTDLSGVLSQSNGVISFASTVIVEAMLLGIPTALIEYRNIPIYLETAWQIRGKDHILPVVRELIHAPSEKIAYQDFCIDDELNYSQASNNLSILIDQIIDCDTNEIEINENHQGHLDYNEIHSQLSVFSLYGNDEIKYELDGYMKHCENIRSNNIKLYNLINSNFFVKMIIKIPFFPFHTILNKFNDHLRYIASINEK